MGRISVEVVFALPGKQYVRRLDVSVGTSARAAVLLSGLEAELAGLGLAELELAGAPLGIFGERLADPDHYCVQAGDRVEIYRPLLRDPKARRRDKAATRS